MGSKPKSGTRSGDVAAAVDELRSVQDLVRWAATTFAKAGLSYGHGTDNPVDEALRLVVSWLGLPHEAAGRCMAARLLRGERQAIADLVQRRVTERRPLPYLTREAWFAGLSFYVDERVLIPRSPIAELIEHGFEPWLNDAAVERILDLCTGSGCIAVACALAFDGARVDAVDVSGQALEVARINVEHYGLEDRVELICADLYAGVAGRHYDLIVTNPPYVGGAEYTDLPPEYGHEPRLALEAGEEGLSCIRRILCQAADHLRPDGVLVAEVGYSRAALEARFPAVPFLWIDLQRGGEGVFVMTAAELRQYRALFCAPAAPPK